MMKTIKPLAAKVVKTSIPTIYTIDSLDTNLDFNPYALKAKTIFSSNAKYVHPAEFKYALPTMKTPEVAFIGRSNVGKSSLIGSLLNDKKLVKTSKSPGMYYVVFIDRY